MIFELFVIVVAVVFFIVHPIAAVGIYAAIRAERQQRGRR